MNQPHDNVMKQIAEDQQAIAPWLNVDDARTAAAVARVRQRVAVEMAASRQYEASPRPYTASPARRVVRIGTWAALAAAAAVLLAVVIWPAANAPVTAPNNNGPVAVAPAPQVQDEFNDPLADLLLAPPMADFEADSLELLTVLATEQDAQFTLDAQLLAALLES
ncbi:MAG: hypothetical protein FWE88_06000 [Phycisphaerae bacterium]|nr:hypothetical protein [Phycisphaerae bacterium]